MVKLNIQTTANLEANSRFRYTLQFLQEHPLCPRDLEIVCNQPDYAHISINYGLQLESDSWQIPAGALFFDRQLDRGQVTLQPNRHLYQNKQISSIGVVELNTPFFEKGIFGFDLLETIFYHISRMEEVFADRKQLNQAGWLQEDRQFLLQHQLHECPVVDEIVAAFFETVSGTIIDQPTTMDLSHDLDILFRIKNQWSYVRAIAANLYHHRGLGELRNICSHWWKRLILNTKDPYDSFDELLRAENKWTAKTLFLMTGGTTKYDNLYNIDDPYIDHVIRMASARGYQFGIHPSYNAGFEAAMYYKEIKKLESKTQTTTVNNRQHWLRFDWQITPYIWAQNGIQIDYSMGYNQHVGFRCGTGFPYRMYDFKNEKAFTWTEVPLVLMDSSVKHFVLKNGGKIGEVIESFLQKNRQNTHISINFHNSNFDELTEMGTEVRKAYAQVIKS